MSLKKIYDKRHTTFQMEGEWEKVLGRPERNGAWLIWGMEKNGKTWLALMISKYLSSFEPVRYMSGEEGTSKNFVETCMRVGLEASNRRITFMEYAPLSEMEEMLKKQRCPRIIIIDNITIYHDELKHGKLRELLHKHKHHLFIFLAHEDRNEPYTSTAKMVRRLAKVIIKVEGLACHVSGRCPGGWLTIDEERAAIYHGHAINHPLSTREAAL